MLDKTKYFHVYLQKVNKAGCDTKHYYDKMPYENKEV